MIQFIRRTAFAVLCALLLWGCSGNPAPESGSGDREDQVYVGLGSYYGYSNSATKPDDDLVSYNASHRTLPLGTRLRVTNLENNISVLVSVNARGPEQKDQILQLSYAPARDLNILSSGVVKLRVEVVLD